MTFDTATHCELRSHHASASSREPYEAWLNTLIDLFESRFPELPVNRFPNTFLIWVRANTTAILALPHPTDAVH